MSKRICFLSTNDFAFGGSEDLWTATALTMARDGWNVAVSAHQWDPLPRAVAALVEAGCTMMWHETPGSADDFAEIVEFDPQLVVVSQGFQLEGMEWLERFVQGGLPFVMINQCVHEAGWVSMDDAMIERMVGLHQAAQEFLFVSDGNRRLYERMAGARLAHAAVVRNPFKVAYDTNLPWPISETLQLATVGRLECFHKGYDLIFEVLSAPKWRKRPVELHLYGGGPHRRLLERLARRSGFPNVTFHGHVSDITEVWRRHHVLLQPSRLEGLPMSIVEAMLCGRPVVATDVAGHGEVITDSVTGFLAAAPTPPLLDVAMERMWEARDRLPAIGNAVRRAIRLLVPADPAAELARRLEGHVTQILAHTPPDRRPPPTVRVVPRSPRRGDDHHAHLYFAEGGQFTEQQKLATDFPRGTWVTLRFSGLHGQVRFDPGADEGVFRIRRVALYAPDTTVPAITLSGADLGQVLSVSGTASFESCSDEGLALISHGNDPIVMFTEALTRDRDYFRLEVELSGE